MEGKKYIKISHLVTSSGAVLASHIFPEIKVIFGPVNGTLNKIPTDLNTSKYTNNNKYKQYFLADSGYDSKPANFVDNVKKYVFLLWKKDIILLLNQIIEIVKKKIRYF